MCSYVSKQRDPDGAGGHGRPNANKQIAPRKRRSVKGAPAKQQYVGLDVHKNTIQVAVMDQDGRVLRNTKIGNTDEEVREEFARIPGSARCVMESSSVWYGLFRFVSDELNMDVILSNPFETRAIAVSRKKTDRVDAEKIAQVLRPGMIPECHVPSAGSRAARDRLRQRAKLVQDGTLVVNRLRNLPGRHDAEPGASQAYSAKAIARMSAMELGEDIWTVRQYARQIAYLNGEIDAVEREITMMAHGSEDARLPAGMTCMGTHSAMPLAAEADGVSRFASPKRMVSWAGLCPTIHQSGNRRYMGRMKKLDTDRTVNRTMIEAANVAVRHDPLMAAV